MIQNFFVYYHFIYSKRSNFVSFTTNIKHELSPRSNREVNSKLNVIYTRIGIREIVIMTKTKNIWNQVFKLHKLLEKLLKHFQMSTRLFRLQTSF